MEMFIIIAIALWLYPIIAFAVKRTKARKKTLVISLISAITIIFCISIGLSTRSDNLDCFLASTIYFSLLMLLLTLYAAKNIITKILAGFLLFGCLAIGYISGSVGLLGIALILNDFKVDRAIYLKDDLVYKQYSLGSAPGDYRGIEISVIKRTKWLPGLEYEIFNKRYDRVFNYKKSEGLFSNSYVALFSNDFDVKYNDSSKTIILMDTIKKDTINLNQRRH